MELGINLVALFPISLNVGTGLTFMLEGVSRTFWGSDREISSRFSKDPWRGKGGEYTKLVQIRTERMFKLSCLTISIWILDIIATYRYSV